MTDNIEKIKDDNIADKYLAFSRAIRKNERQKTAKAIFEDIENEIPNVAVKYIEIWNGLKKKWGVIK